MASLRRRIVSALADLFASGLDWQVSTRGQVDQVTGQKIGIVYDTGESKSIQNGAGCSGGQYRSTLTVEVRVFVDPALTPEGGNPFDELDDAVSELEALVPWQSDLQPILGVPGVVSLDYGNLIKDQPDEDTGLLGAILRLDVLYRHDLANPSTIGGLS